MIPSIKSGRRKKLTSLLGLALDGTRLTGVVLHRQNDSLQQLQTFGVTLTLDPLTAAPELVGREIRNHLDAAGVRERYCVVGVPLKWVLTAQTELRKLVIGLIKERIQPHLDNGAARIELMLQSARKLPAGERAILLKRIEILKNWRSKTSKALPFIVRFLST